MITPFLALVLAGFTSFMLVLGAVWLRGYVADLPKVPTRRKAEPIAPASIGIKSRAG